MRIAVAGGTGVVGRLVVDVLAADGHEPVVLARSRGVDVAAGQRAGVGHHVALSIVGIDRVDYGYYEGKRRQEDLVLAGPLPAS